MTGTDDSHPELHALCDQEVQHLLGRIEEVRERLVGLMQDRPERRDSLVSAMLERERGCPDETTLATYTAALALVALASTDARLRDDQSPAQDDGGSPVEDDLILDRLVADVGLMIARLREFVGEHPDAGWLLIQRAAARRALEDPDGQRLFNTALAVISCAAPDEGRSPT